MNEKEIGELLKRKITPEAMEAILDYLLAKAQVEGDLKAFNKLLALLKEYQVYLPEPLAERYTQSMGESDANQQENCAE